VLVIFFAVGVGVWSTGWRSSPQESYFGGIACHEVQEQMPAMLAGTLPVELKARIEAHLQQCPACREMMRKMQTGQAVASGHHEHWAASCPQCRQRFAQAVVNALGTMEIEGTVVAVSLPSNSYSDRH
jgi:hypothetical protein